MGAHYEFMEDIVRSEESWYNPCFHRKISVKVNPLAIQPIEDEMGRTWSRLIVGDGSTSFVPKSLIERVLWQPNSGELSEASIRARVHAIAALDPEVDFGAFATELFHSVKSILKVLLDYRGKVKQAQTNVINRYNYLRHRKDLLLDEAACWKLAYEFGMKPFLSDLKALQHAFDKSRKRLQWLRERNGQSTLVKSRYDVSLDPGDTVTIMDIGAPGSASAIAARQGLAVSIPDPELCWAKIAVSHLVKFDIPTEALGYYGERISLAAYLGLYNPVATAWELTKFSWLFDWFVGYRNRVTIRDLSLSPLKDAEVIASMTSIKTVQKGKIFWVVDNGYEGTNIVYHEIGDFLCTTYVRFPGEISTDNAPQLNIPFDWDKFFISLSLLVQRAFRRRRKR